MYATDHISSLHPKDTNAIQTKGNTKWAIARKLNVQSSEVDHDDKKIEYNSK